MNSILSFFVRRLIRTGTLTIVGAAGDAETFGDGSGDPLTARFNSRAAERAVAVNPALKFGECYMNGGVDIIQGTIFDVLKLIFQNAGPDASSEPWMQAIEKVRLLGRRFVQNNSKRRSRRNVQTHYDLSRELYALFLDDDLQYSCAYFETPDATLEAAQLAKKRHIAAKLGLDKPGLSVLDIGSGWGGLGLYLASRCGANVTGVTLSDEQFALSNERAARAKLAGKARFMLQDYRTVDGTFDRIVSVGMFEHVGRDFYDTFFKQARSRLAPDGVMLLHTIGRHNPPRNTNSFIERYIFPGGYIPSLSEVMPAIERSGLIATDVEILRLHYSETCRNWRERFAARRDEAKALYDERFCRMWEFYLAVSECSFRWEDLVVFQIQLTRRLDALPITRDYMRDAEERLRSEDETLGTAAPSRVSEPA